MSNRFARSVIVACVGALSVASIDGAAGYIASGGRFSSPAYALMAVAMTALLAFAIILVVRWLVVAPLFRSHADRDALSIACAMAVVAFLLAFDVASTRTGIARLLEWTLDAVLALVTAIGWYSLAVGDARHTESSTARVAGRLLAFAMPLALLVAWVIFEAINDVTSVGAVVTVIAFGISVLVLLRVVATMSSRAWSVAAVSVFVALAGLGAIGLLRATGAGAIPVPPAHARGTGAARQVILLTVDTLRRDALSCYGSQTVRTPNIDRLAADGCLFRNTTSSSSWTEPAFASMMTGLPTYGHGVINAATILPDTVVTLAERFRDAGYATCAINANGMLGAGRGFAQGFDQYMVRKARLAPVCVGEMLAARFDRDPVEEDSATRDVTDVATAWSQAHRDQDFFLWVHYYDPHLPYQPPRRFVERMNVHDTLGYSLDLTSLVRPTSDLFGDPAGRAWARSLYDADVRYVDAEIGRLVSSLKSSGIYDNALIVFGVDHGEEFWDHDEFEHGHSLYEELIGVPLAFKPPASSPAAVRSVDEAMSVYDIAPTVLEMCGLPAVKSPTGISLLARINGTQPRLPERPIYSGATLFRSNWESVTFDGWKFIRSGATGREWLFQLASDPGEQRSLALQRPDIVARGRELLDEHERAMEAFREGEGISNPTVEMDAEELERLRTLGYL